MQASFKKFNAWRKDFLSRRPHRSFRLTRRRDYVRSLELPGYIAFTHHVNKTLWQHKKLFMGLVFVYLVLLFILVGIGSQDTYLSLINSLKDSSSSVADGDISQLGQAGLVFLSIASVGISTEPTEAQQIYTIILSLLVFLTTVWLLRNIMAGHKVKLRDGLYSAGAPIISLVAVTLVLLVQMIPIFVAIIAYGAASGTGLLLGGVEAMLFWIAASLLALLSIFWATSTFFGMIIVTLPGMYPMKALRNAGDLVLGRRVKIVLRWLWMFLMIAVFWAAVLIPVILLDLWLKDLLPVLNGVPIVPVVLALLGAVSVLWFSAYVYLLYRKVVDEHKQ